MIAFVATLHCIIVDVAFYDLVYMIMEDCIHGILICYPDILQAEGHHSVAIHPRWHSEGCVLFIFMIHLDLIIP